MSSTAAVAASSPAAPVARLRRSLLELRTDLARDREMRNRRQCRLLQLVTSELPTPARCRTEDPGSNSNHAASSSSSNNNYNSNTSSSKSNNKPSCSNLSSSSSSNNNNYNSSNASGSAGRPIQANSYLGTAGAVSSSTASRPGPLGSPSGSGSGNSSGNSSSTASSPAKAADLATTSPPLTRSPGKKAENEGERRPCRAFQEASRVVLGSSSLVSGHSSNIMTPEHSDRSQGMSATSSREVGRPCMSPADDAGSDTDPDMPELLVMSPAKPSQRRNSKGSSGSFSGRIRSVYNSEEDDEDDEDGPWSSSMRGLKILQANCLDDDDDTDAMGSDLSLPTGALGCCWGSGALQGALKGFRWDAIQNGDGAAASTSREDVAAVGEEEQHTLQAQQQTPEEDRLQLSGTPRKEEHAQEQEQPPRPEKQEHTDQRPPPMPASSTTSPVDRSSGRRASSSSSSTTTAPLSNSEEQQSLLEDSELEATGNGRSQPYNSSGSNSCGYGMTACRTTASNASTAHSDGASICRVDSTSTSGSMLG